jgi:hypothetical protein
MDRSQDKVSAAQEFLSNSTPQVSGSPGKKEGFHNDQITERKEKNKGTIEQ